MSAAFATEDGEVVAEAPAGEPEGAAGRAVVLVVEDDALAAEFIRVALQDSPVEVVLASDAASLLAAMKTVQPALILMDIHLPGMDGLALTERLKARPSLADIPVVVLTGDARIETVTRSRAVGAAGFLVKPFSREALLAKITPLLTS